MSTVDRYLFARISAGLLIAAMVLLPLFGFLDLVDQLDDVGKGFYRAADAFLYVALMMPRRFIQLAPFIALVGNVIGLGRLAVQHELTAMRSAGLSPVRIGRASLVVGTALVALMMVMEFTVAPRFEQKALALRAEALTRSAELGEELGIWTRDAHDILRMGSAPRAGRVQDVEIMHLDGAGRLAEYLHAQSAVIGRDGRWVLQDVTRKQFSPDGIRTTHGASRDWQPFVKPNQIASLTRTPDSLPPVALYQYIAYLESTGQKFDEYALALWQKPGGALTTIAMLLLSIPFAFGSVRTGIGGRLLLATVTGIAVYLLNQILSSGGLLLGMNPALIALAPGTALVGLGYWALHRTA